MRQRVTSDERRTRSNRELTCLCCAEPISCIDKVLKMLHQARSRSHRPRRCLWPKTYRPTAIKLVTRCSDIPERVGLRVLDSAQRLGGRFGNGRSPGLTDCREWSRGPVPCSVPGGTCGSTDRRRGWRIPRQRGSVQPIRRKSGIGGGLSTCLRKVRHNGLRIGGLGHSHEYGGTARIDGHI